MFKKLSPTERILATRVAKERSGKTTALLDLADEISRGTPLVIPEDAVIGWRAFWPAPRREDRPERAVLGSFHFSQTYRPGVPMAAVCMKKKPHAVAAEECECGIHSAASLLSIFRRPGHGLNAPIYGRVAQWGTVTKTERGHRSQFAYPVMLFTDTTYFALCQAFCFADGLAQMIADAGLNPTLAPAPGYCGGWPGFMEPPESVSCIDDDVVDAHINMNERWWNDHDASLARTRDEVDLAHAQETRWLYGREPYPAEIPPGDPFTVAVDLVLAAAR